MKSPKCQFFLFFVFCFVFSAGAQDSGFVVHDSSKELRRIAHRLGIPVEQVKILRQTLQETTDLAKRMEQLPADQLPHLAGLWRQVEPRKANAVIESFIEDLRSEAENASEAQIYSNATSAAMALMGWLDPSDRNKRIQIVENWPEPAFESGTEYAEFRENARKQVLGFLAYSDPEQALSLISRDGNSQGCDYEITANIAHGLMNAGKKEEALRLINQAVDAFTQHSDNPKDLQGFQQFVRMSMMYLDPPHASAAMAQLIPSLISQASADGCKGMLRVGDQSLKLTCSEYRELILLRSIAMRPGIMQQTLESLHGLRTKLDSIGGIDSLFMANTIINEEVEEPGHPEQSRSDGPSGEAKHENALMQLTELTKKAESNPAFIRNKLQETAEREGGIETLVGLAYSLNYQDPELASFALEVAGRHLGRVESLQKRSNLLRMLIPASREIDGEINPELLQSGFDLVDQLRLEKSETETLASQEDSQVQSQKLEADQIEALIIAELARDNFDDAMHYVRSMENESLKLKSLLQIVQALTQRAY